MISIYTVIAAAVVTLVIVVSDSVRGINQNSSSEVDRLQSDMRHRFAQAILCAFLAFACHMIFNGIFHSVVINALTGIIGAFAVYREVSLFLDARRERDLAIVRNVLES